MAKASIISAAETITGEHVDDAVLVIKRSPLFWPVAAVLVAGFVVAFSSLKGGNVLWFAVLGGVVGLAMTFVQEARFVARTPTRYVLMKSARLIGRPRSIIKDLVRSDISLESTSSLNSKAMIAGESHIVSRLYVERLRTLLGPKI